MRKLWKWSVAVLGLVVLFGLVLAPAASAWYPGNSQPRYQTYRYPTYPSYPNYGNTYARCAGCPNYNLGGYNYVYPNNSYLYNYSYVYPYNSYPYNNNNNYNNYNNYNNGYDNSYSYVPQPPAYNGGWGSFGTYQNWANAFFHQHGRWPNQQDINDYWWSQGFARANGFSPYQY